jgi:hypothetical protein
MKLTKPPTQRILINLMHKLKGLGIHKIVFERREDLLATLKTLQYTEHAGVAMSATAVFDPDESLEGQIEISDTEEAIFIQNYMLERGQGYLAVEDIITIMKASEAFLRINGIVTVEDGQ